MAEGLFLVRQTLRGGDSLINGVQSVLINDDDADTLAQHITAAIGACNLAYPKDANGSDPFPVGYFDTADEVSDLTAGILKDDGDAIVFGAVDIQEVGT